MRHTLYFKIILMTMLIMLVGGLIAFVTTNVYYHFTLKQNNDEKITRVAKSVQSHVSDEKFKEVDAYLTDLTDLGYQFQLYDEVEKVKAYGTPFRDETLPPSILQSIIDGDVYHGIGELPFSLYITGFFKNSLTNTIGVPLKVNGKDYALFVRPDTKQQFGEMRIFLAIMLTLLLIFSFLLILIGTRYIVRPLKKLTEATRKIASGYYHIQLDLHQNDEIGRLAADFSKMAKALSETEQKREEFVSNVSHEIQSPLTSINGFSQALREKDLTEEMKDSYLTIIENETKRLSLLTKQLLTLSFLDDTEDLEWTIINVEEQLKEVMKGLRWKWQQKDLYIEIDTSPTYVYGNLRLLYQVWHNLLSNAIRYTNEGGEIHIKTYTNYKTVFVEIEDSGIGISKEHIPYIFERFYKVDEARVRTKNSTGLGLAIVKKIVQLHDAHISVSSILDEGTKFVVQLEEAMPLSEKKQD